MPKIKTHKAPLSACANRSGKLLRTKGERRHLRRNRSARAKRVSWRMLEVVTPGEIKRVSRLAPYLKKG